jgi:hypothetical protein
MLRAYEEVIDFIAAGASPTEVSEFTASQASRNRVADLIAGEKTTGLSADETKELEHYLELEHIMRLAKAKARELAQK